MNTKKAQQHEELIKRVQQLEVASITLRQQALGAPNSPQIPKISLPTKCNGTWSQFQAFLT